MKQIYVGTILNIGDAVDMIPKFAKLGFECFEINAWMNIDGINVEETFKRIREKADETGTFISCAGLYGGPLGDKEENEKARHGIKTIIDHCFLLGTDLFCGFTGRADDRPLTESLPAFKNVWGEFLKRAESKNMRIAFENCDMGCSWNTGKWNIAFNPDAWELMFNEIDSNRIGLEWEPCHQLCQLMDPIPQLRKWAKKIFHVHGKDATIAWDVLKTHGLRSAHWYSWNRTPGFGDSNWADIISILRMNGYDGNIDIEGFHDPVYKNELEISGQVTALEYLKRCRGGDLITL